MIYRFLSGWHGIPPNRLLGNKNWIYGRFGGAWTCGFLNMPMPAPEERINPRARFYLTELGFRLFSNDIIKSALECKQALKVIRRKNPKRSQIVYKDKYQVAILEEK